MPPLPGHGLDLLHRFWEPAVACLGKQEGEQAGGDRQQAEDGGGHGVVDVALGGGEGGGGLESEDLFCF